MSLLQELQREIDRAKDLRASCDEIPGGGSGSAVIRGIIQKAERSIADGDVVAMLAAYQALEVLE